jgi:hypothetical protein
MNTARIEVDRAQAQKLYRLYREHRDQATAQDLKIESVYRQIAGGKKVIMAFESIRQAGLDDQGRPKLAIIRADAQWAFLRKDRDRLSFQMESWPRGNSRRTIVVPWTGMEWASTSAKARVPLVPLHIRPKSNLSNYYILWEADWEHAPVDPMLLRRYGGDLWLVLAAWDLTAVERAVLSGAG